jgi:heme exporter protein A
MAVIAGSNGSGKTTLLETLAGLSLAVAGQITFSGTQDSQVWLNNSLYLGHKLGNKANLTCLENLQFAAAIHGVKTHESQLEQVLDRAGLPGYEYQFASDLSAGQKKRLALSRLLLLNKPFWLLDEPFVNLDHAGCDWLCAIISQHLQQQGAVLISAHDQQKIHQLADHHINLQPPAEAFV